MGLFAAQIDDLQLVSNKTSFLANDTSRISYHFEELEPTYVSCRSKGGNPQPQVRIYRGKTDITGEFYTRIVESRTGDVGLEVISYDIRVESAEFRATSEHTGKNLKCVSRIHKLPHMKKMVSGVMDVRCKFLLDV